MDLQSILNKIITDTELYNKFVSLNSQEEIYKFLNDNGYSESYEFFCEQLDNVKDNFTLESLENSELDEVSGGANLKQIFKAGGAGILAYAMAFGGLGANATKLSDQCIDLASQISSRQNPNVTIINNYDRGIANKVAATMGFMLVAKHVANNNIFKNIANLFNKNNIGGKALEKIHSNPLANFGEYYKSCIIECHKNSSIARNSIKSLTESIKDIANNYGITHFGEYQEHLNKLVEMSKNNYFNIEDLIMNTKNCFAFINNENIEKLETDVFEYGMNLHQKLSDNVYRNEDIPAPFTDAMRNVARELKPLFENCYRAYWHYYEGRKDQTKDPYDTDKYMFENNLRPLMNNKYFEQLVSFKSRNELWDEYKTKILNNKTDDKICGILNDIWNQNIRNLIQDNSDIENGSQISMKARESTGFKYATQNTNLSDKKSKEKQKSHEEIVTRTSVDTKLFNSAIFNELYNECKIDEAIKFFGNTDSIPTSDKCQKDIMPFMYNIRDSIYVIKNMLSIMNSDKYKELVNRRNMSNELEIAIQSVESCREITSSAIQIFIFNNKQDETASCLVHDWLINKAEYNKKLSTAIEFINNFFSAYNSKFDTTNLKNNFEKYNKVLEQRSQEDWYWYHGKDNPKTKEFEEKFENFEETNDYMLELCKLRNEYMKNHFLYNYRPLFEKFEQLLDKYNVDISDLNYVDRILHFNEENEETPEELLKEIKKDESVKQRGYLENLWTKEIPKKISNK